jgi:two-component system NtrC family response regulator
VGENESLIVDVRVVCATHRNLEEMVHDGDFREDLMFRINTFEIRLPSLRDRVEDIPALANHLLRRFRPTAKPNDVLYTPEALAALKHHVWPGNVRELANVIEHAAILNDDGAITVEDLPHNFDARRLRASSLKISGGPMTLRELEMQAIQHALDRHAGNKPKAAEELGVSLKTLYNKLNQVAQLDQSA